MHHVYGDKFALVEAQLSASVVSCLHALQHVGLTPEKLRTLCAWAAGGAAVTLRFTADVRCAFTREARREKAPDVAVKQEQSVGGVLVKALTTSVVTTVTEYFWSVGASWALEAFRGAGRSEGDVVALVARASIAHELKSLVKTAPVADADAAAAHAAVMADPAITRVIQKMWAPCIIFPLPHATTLTHTCVCFLLQ